MPAVDWFNTRLRAIPVWCVYAALVIPAAYSFYQALTGQLGADPVRAFEQALGLVALKLIVAGLCVTPLRTYVGVNFLRFRRAIGVMAFAYVIMHLLAWFVLDMGMLVGQAAGDIIKRPYITIGMAGLLLLLPVAITSNNAAVRRLGAARWNRLHQLTYPAAAAGAIHYVWLGKTWYTAAAIYLVIVAVLLGVRKLPKRRRAMA